MATDLRRTGLTNTRGFERRRHFQGDLIPGLTQVWDPGLWSFATSDFAPSPPLATVGQVVASLRLQFCILLSEVSDRSRWIKPGYGQHSMDRHLTAIYEIRNVLEQRRWCTRVLAQRKINRGYDRRPF